MYVVHLAEGFDRCATPGGHIYAHLWSFDTTSKVLD